jgi:thioredoxin-related protein
MTKKIATLLLLMLFVSASAIAQNWLTDFNQARTKAVAEDKNILLVFSGSDWCAPCMKLDRFIWQSEEFKAFSNDHFILLRADFPKQKKNKLSDEQQAHNDRLAAKYNRNGYFPLVVILNKNGEIIGTTGYKNLSPAEYIKQLIALEK